MGQLCQPGAQLGRALVDVGEEVVVHLVQHGQRTGAADRVAAERRAVGAGLHVVGDLFVHQHRADGQTAAEPLRQRDDVGVQIKMLARQELAGAAHAGLHLVHNDKDVFFPAERRDPGDVVRVQRDDAALALHQLHHDGAGVLVGGLFQRGKVARGHVVKISREGAEVVVEHVLAGGGQGRQCAAMEGVDQRDDLIPALSIHIYAVFAGALDRALVGLGARVAEKHGVQPGAAAELFRQLAVGGGVIQVRRVLQRCGLVGHSPDPRGVAVAQRVDADARREVKVALAVGVPGRHALALRQHDLAAAIGVEDVVVITGNNFFGIQLGDPLF